MELTAKFLRERLDYLPDSGEFVWKISPSQNVKAGAVARPGRRSGKYCQIKICGRLYYAHRLAWLHVYGEWPKDLVDHIDGDRSNNRISNLREATVSENGQNQRAPMRNNKAGFLGVSPVGKKFKALIAVNGKTLHLGTFDDAYTAHQAYLTSKRALHVGCSI